MDDAERLRLVAGDLRKHSRTAVMAAEYVEQAANAAAALREKIRDRERWPWPSGDGGGGPSDDLR